MTRITGRLLVADEVWLIVARLHQSHPSQEAFSVSSIIGELRKVNLTGEFRPGVIVHVNLHSVANLPPNPARYRMLFKLPNGNLRLYRPGDPAHPARNGKITPDRERLPAEHHRYLDWYREVYCADHGNAEAPSHPRTDKTFIDKLTGLGKAIWSGTSADAYVSELRKDWDS